MELISPGNAGLPAGMDRKTAGQEPGAPGYKQTEVGVIPEDWEVRHLRDILINGRLGGNYPNQLSETSAPLIKMGNLARGHIDLSKIEYIPNDSAIETTHRLKFGDVLFNTRNTLDLVGKVAMWRDELPVAYYNSNLMRLEFDPSAVGSSVYANYALNTESAVSRLRGLATGTTSVAAIYTRDLLKFAIPLPPLPEQRAIATALSEVDGLIRAQEQLIAKKRDLKQAAMQQLLTAQHRLPGFSGEWVTRRLDEIVDTDPENLGSATDPNYSFKYISLEDVDCGTLRSFTEQVFANAPSRARRILRRNDVLVSTVRPNLLSHLLFQKDEPDWVCSTGFCVVRCRAGITHPGFIFQHFFASIINRQIETLLTGSNYPSMNGRDVRALELQHPPLPEQTAIAEVLSEQDEELAALEARLAKTRALKQGMMQSLLTGRIRLV